MATSFAQQLRQIAANSTNELDLKARRNLHAESLLFERNVAIRQDWDTIYQLCLEGFRELCTLDVRLRDFERSLFSAHAKDQDRDQFNKAQNEDLDNTIELCLRLLGSRLTFRPGVRALEWLIRRFRIHVHNVRALLLTVLPHHESPLFRNVLNLIPLDKLTDEWKFLRPYHQSPTPIPRHAVTYAATNNDGFFARLNEYTLETCRKQTSHPTLMRVWGSIVIEAVSSRLNQAKSGRQEIQRQRTEDVLHKVLPVLDEGLSSNLSPDLTLTCYALALILANTALLDDLVIDSLLDSISRSFSTSDTGSHSALVALVLLASHKSEITVPKKTASTVLRLEDIPAYFEPIARDYAAQNLLVGTIRTTLKSMRKKNFEEKLRLLRKLLLAGPRLANDTDLSHWFVAVLSEVQRLNVREPFENTLRSRLIGLMQDLCEDDAFQPAFGILSTLCKQNGIDIEALLQTAIQALSQPAEVEDLMEVDEQETTTSTFDRLVATLPSQLPDEVYFLSSIVPAVYATLADLLLLSNKDDAQLKAFAELPLWTASIQLPAFLLRIIYSHSSQQLRQDAATLLPASVRRDIDSSSHGAMLASQLLPYLSVLLADPLPMLRRAACSAILEVQKLLVLPASDEPAATQLVRYSTDPTVNISHLNSNTLTKVLDNVYLPNLEEFATDSSQISLALQHALNGTIDQSLKSTSGELMELKKALRQSLLENLAGHAMQSPLLRFKTGTIQLLRGVLKAGSTKKSDALLPVLKQWANLTSEEAQSWASAEGLQTGYVDTTMASLLSARDLDTISRILQFHETAKITPREDLVNAIFERLVQVWADLASDADQDLALKLFDLALSEKPVFARNARAALQQVKLSTEALQILLDHAMTGPQNTTEQPPTKKRRISSSGAPKPSSITTSFRQNLPRLALALETLEGSRPENHTVLLPKLMDVLLFLRRIKDHLQAESPYVLSTCLSVILAVVEKLRTARKPSIDWASVRADLIAECVRTSESPQVQTLALMLSASLASIAPEKIIHHIMPVFTFMGNRMLAQNDQHSVNVINQAIDEIVPPLVSALKKQNPENIFQSTKSVLSSFVAAFDHIPDQRKVPLFQRLLRQLGAGEFGFAIVAMFAGRERVDEELSSFIDKVLDHSAPEVHLSTYTKLVSLAEDCVADKPHNASALLNISTSTSHNLREKTAANVLGIAGHIASNNTLRLRAIKMSKTDATAKAAIDEQFRTCFLQTLGSLQRLQHHEADVREAASKCMVALLELVSVKQLIESLTALLDQLPSSNLNLKPRALRLLSTRLTGKGSSDGETARVAIDYLTALEDILDNADDTALQFAAIECIDRISTKYGRRDATALVSPARVITGDVGLASPDSNIQLVAAVTLSSMLGYMRDAAVPIVPDVLEGTFQMIESSMRGATENEASHNAAFGLIASVVHSVSFMVSEGDLDRILIIASQAASGGSDTSATARREALVEVAKRIDTEVLSNSLLRVWATIIEHGVEGTLQILEMFGTAVDHHPKSEIISNADTISTLLQGAFDLRRSQNDSGSFSSSDLVQAETSLNALALKFIYKLNDATFRPIFSVWVDWAVLTRDIANPSSTDRLHRQTTLTSFLAHFFTTLKSIVTSYASPLLPFANTALQSFRTSNPPSSSPTALTFYTNLLSALTAALIHDNDAFFSAPSHFSPLATNLISQLDLASHKSLRSLTSSNIIPTIVALATAIQDTSAHHLAMNHYLAQLRHADSAAVRLASIRTHIAITEDEGVGEEWVNNVVSGSVGTESTGEGGEKAGVGGSGETMIYVNEMLEDDDEEVEREVRRWVRMVREMVGEEVFEN